MVNMEREFITEVRGRAPSRVQGQSLRQVVRRQSPLKLSTLLHYRNLRTRHKKSAKNRHKNRQICPKICYLIRRTFGAMFPTAPLDSPVTSSEVWHWQKVNWRSKVHCVPKKWRRNRNHNNYTSNLICHRSRSSAERDQSLSGNSSNNFLAL